MDKIWEWSLVTFDNLPEDSDAESTLHVEVSKDIVSGKNLTFMPTNSMAQVLLSNATPKKVWFCLDPNHS